MFKNKINRKKLIKELGLEDKVSPASEVNQTELTYLLRSFDWRRELKALISTIIGCLISAVGILVFYNPMHLTMGGISGIAAIVYNLTGQGKFLSYGTLVAIFNIPPLLIGWWQFSWRFVRRSVIGSFIYSFVLILTEPWLNTWFDKYINKSLINGKPDPFIFCIFGGAIFGIGLGYVLKVGYTTGGTDILGLAIHRHFPNLSIGSLLFIVDALIVASTVVFYQNEKDSAVLLAMYSFVAMWVGMKGTDFVLDGFDHSRMAFIVTGHPEDVATAIFVELNRGATLLQGTGMYSGKDRPVIYCVLNSKQVPRLKDIIHEIDPDAFVAINEAREVQGEGFENSLQEFM